MTEALELKEGLRYSTAHNADQGKRASATMGVTVSWTVWIGVGAIFAGLGVAFGAFGAHALRDRLTVEDLSIFEIAARYQMYHALALIAVGLTAVKIDNTAIVVAGCAFIIGIVLFCGSLYTMALSEMRWLGMVTPLGGAAFLVGWISLAIAAFKPN